MRSLLFTTLALLSIIALHSESVDGKRAKRCRACSRKRHGQEHNSAAPVFQTTSPASSSVAPAGSSSSSGQAVVTSAPSKTSSSSVAPTTTQRQTNEEQADNQNDDNNNQDGGNNQDGNKEKDNNNNNGGDGSVRTYKVQDRFEGRSFFDNFDFQNIPDPTHGSVNYMTKDGALGAGLAYVEDDGVAVMKVDDYSWVGEGANRNSVRIQSKAAYTSGLIVLDVNSMPYGCGVWPAFWTVGPNWPNGGEIDILENVHDTPNNHMTLHTAAGCTIDRSFQKLTKRKRTSTSAFPHVAAQEHGKRGSHSGRAVTGPPISFTGTILAENCDANINSNTGCGIKDPNPNSYGSALNNAGGGVFATLINEDGVAVWFFPRDQIPQDLQKKSPQPATWSSPKAFWASSQCPTGKFFREQRIIINTTLCGDWAGATYGSVGCPGSCAQRVSDPNNFKTAQWKIRSVTVYN